MIKRDIYRIYIRNVILVIITFSNLAVQLSGSAVVLNYREQLIPFLSD